MCGFYLEFIRNFKSDFFKIEFNRDYYGLNSFKLIRGLLGIYKGFEFHKTDLFRSDLPLGHDTSPLLHSNTRTDTTASLRKMQEVDHLRCRKSHSGEEVQRLSINNIPEDA